MSGCSCLVFLTRTGRPHLTWHLAATMMAGSGLAQLDVCGRWLLVRLLGIATEYECHAAQAAWTIEGLTLAEQQAIQADSTRC
jgi:hypothetical protein